MRRFHTPGLISHTLANGLRVVLCPDDRLPIAAVCVWYKVGAHDEPPGRTGLAHLFEHMMFQGSARVGANEHTAYIQSVGGATNGDTTHEGTYFFDEIPSNHLRPVLWLEAERMASVGDALCEERLENQRLVVVNERRQRYDNRPLALVREHLLTLATPEGHPYQHMPAGHLADLHAITLEDARRFWHRYYTPGNAVLTVVGDLEADQTMTWIEQYFAAIPSGEALIIRPCPPPVIMPGSTCEHTTVHVQHAGAMYAYRLPPGTATDAAAAEFAVSLLGDSPNGRLRQNLLSRALAAGFGFDLLPLAHAPSTAIFSMASAGEAALPAIDATVRETVSQLAGTGPAEEELALMKAGRARASQERLATVEGRAIELARGTALHDDPAHAHTTAARIASLRSEEVAEAAARYLLRADRAVVTYGRERRH